MRIILRVAAFAVILSIFAPLAIPSSAEAATKHHHHVKKKTKHTAHKKTNNSLREAQTHLVNLNLLTGKADGIMGPKTKAAIIMFQRQHHIHPNGALTPATFEALRAADPYGPGMTRKHPGATPTAEGPHDFFAEHPDFYGHVNQEYADALQFPHAAGNNGGSQGLASRYAQITVAEDASTAMRRYAVTVNNTQVLQVGGQPSVIGISKTYQIGDEDAIIFTTYNAENPACAYQQNLLALRQDGMHLFKIDDCTHEYLAGVYEGSLFITFPEHETARNVGAMWRYDNGNLIRL